MSVTFDLASMTGLARSGRLRARHQVSGVDVTVRTPAFIPRLHPALLGIPAYVSTLESLINGGKLQAMVIPRGFDGKDTPVINDILARILTIEEQHVQDTVRDTGASSTAAILHHPYQTAAFGETAHTWRTDQLLAAARAVDRSIASRCAIAVNDASTVTIHRDDPFWGVASTATTMHQSSDARVASFLGLAGTRVDTCRLLSAPTMPRDLAHAVSCGHDAIIESGYLAASARGQYLTIDGVTPLDRFHGDPLPCPCVHCETLGTGHQENKARVEDRMHLYLHALRLAAGEMAGIRQGLRDGTFRDHVERQAHASTALAVLQRKLDLAAREEHQRRVDLASTATIRFTGTESYRRPEVVAFRAKIIRHYHVPPATRVLVLLPCSARKPYSQSPSHGKFASAMDKGWKRWRDTCSEIIITSPIGIVPRAVERCFPAAHYDVPVTGQWDEQELAFTGSMLLDIMQRHLDRGGRLDAITAHLDGGYRLAVERVAGQLPVPVTFTGPPLPATSREALDGLEATMRDVEARVQPSAGPVNVPRPAIVDLRGLIDFQFETELGEHLVPRDAVLKSVHGTFLEVRDPGSKKPLFRRDDRHGYVTLEEEGMHVAWNAAMTSKTSAVKRVVFPGEAIAGTSLFPSGIQHADPAIKTGDDVFIQGTDGKLLGYGRAVVPGPVMMDAGRGAMIKIVKKARR